MWGARGLPPEGITFFVFFYLILITLVIVDKFLKIWCYMPSRAYGCTSAVTPIYHAMFLTGWWCWNENFQSLKRFVYTALTPKNKPFLPPRGEGFHHHHVDEGTQCRSPFAFGWFGDCCLDQPPLIPPLEITYHAIVLNRVLCWGRWNPRVSALATKVTP